jgi:hypothetical protein
VRRAARVDRNQAEIVEALRKGGCTVFPTHQVGKGFPDIFVWSKGQPYLLEIKDGSKPPSARKLTEDEESFHQLFHDMRQAGLLAVVASVDEALEAVGAT